MEISAPQLNVAVEALKSIQALAGPHTDMVNQALTEIQSLGVAGQFHGLMPANIFDAEDVVSAALILAVVDCGHSIDDKRVTLRREKRFPDDNCLQQITKRLYRRHRILVSPLTNKIVEQQQRINELEAVAEAAQHQYNDLLQKIQQQAPVAWRISANGSYEYHAHEISAKNSRLEYEKIMESEAGHQEPQPVFGRLIIEGNTAAQVAIKGSD